MVAVERTDLSKSPFLTLNAKNNTDIQYFTRLFSVFDYFTVLEEVIWSNFSRPLQLALVLTYTKYLPRFEKMTKILNKTVFLCVYTSPSFMFEYEVKQTVFVRS